MTDDELRYLAGRIDAMPAGASDAGTVLLLIVIIAVIWWAWKR
jgi:cbb3-type cytochrome oxidase subunit 3